MSHTILLIQRTSSLNTRTYSEYESVQAAIEGIVDLFEAKLKRGRSSGGKLDYKLADLEAFVDESADFVALVFNAEHNMYSPKSKDWIKKGLERHILRLAKAASK